MTFLQISEKLIKALRWVTLHGTMCTKSNQPASDIFNFMSDMSSVFSYLWFLESVWGGPPIFITIHIHPHTHTHNMQPHTHARARAQQQHQQCVIRVYDEYLLILLCQCYSNCLPNTCPASPAPTSHTHTSHTWPACREAHSENRTIVWTAVYHIIPYVAAILAG